MKQLYTAATNIALMGVSAMSAAMATGVKPSGVFGGIWLLVDMYLFKEGGGLL